MFPRARAFATAHRQSFFQFFRYGIGGLSAALLELLSFKLLLVLGVWYLLASPLSNGVGIVSAFLFHKYFAFKRSGQIGKHAIRYALLTAFNLCAQTAVVFLLVHFAHVDPVLAKICGIAMVVCWNFFLYKFVVYA